MSSSSTSFAETGLPETCSSTSIFHPINFLSFAISTSSSTLSTNDNSYFNANTDANITGTTKPSSTPIIRPKVRSHHSSPLPSLTPFRSEVPLKSPGMSPTKMNINLKRNWNPALPPSIPSVGDVDRKIGQASPDKGNYKIGIVEKGLSELYVSHERREREQSPTKAGPSRHPSALDTRDNNMDIDSTSIRSINSVKDKGKHKTAEVDHTSTQRKRSGWGETLVSGAVTAGVFGAALGLSAYRLWTMRNDSDSPSEDDVQGEEGASPDTDTDTVQLPIVDDTIVSPVQAESSTLTLTPTPTTAMSPPHTAEMPPPAYEETEGVVKLTARQRERSRDDWEELEELLTPSSSRISNSTSISTSSPHRTRRRHVKGKNSRKFKSSISKAYPIPNHVEITNPLEGLPTISTCSFSISTPPDSPLRQKAEQGQNRDEEEEEASATATSDEVVARLDNLSLQLTLLIEQGRRALESTSGLGVTPGWEDLHGVDHQQHPPWATDTTTSTSRDGTPAGESEIPKKLNINTEDNLGKKSTFDLRDVHHLGSGPVQERERTRSKIPVRSKSMAGGLTATSSLT